MKKLISIIVPVYNAERYLDECIKSIISQSYKELEIIFVDDGSTDSSLKILKKWQKQDKRINVFHQKNHGVSCARNKGIKESNGEYISFIDADDFLDKKFYAELINYFSDDIDIVICNYNYYKGSSIIQNRNVIKSKKIGLNEYIKYTVGNTIIKGYLWNRIYKRKIIIDNNVWFNEKVGIQEDLDFNLRLSKYIKKTYYCNQKLYFYRQVDDSVTHKVNTGIELSTLFCLPNIIKILDDNYIDSRYFKELFIYLNGKSIYIYKSNYDLDYSLNNELSHKFSKEFYRYSLKGKIKVFMINCFPRITYTIYNFLESINSK